MKQSHDISIRSLATALTITVAWASISLAEGTDNTNQPDVSFLDYNVPESPAAVALGATPENVLSGSAAKPVAVSLLSQIGKGDKLEGGVALDFLPYFVFGGQLRNIDEYRSDGFKRLMARTSLSAATLEDPDVANSLRFGLGVRTTLIDSRDLLQQTAFTDSIDAALMRAATSPSEAGGEDQVIYPNLDGSKDTQTNVDLSPIYKSARKNAEKVSGDALSIGYAFGGRLNGAVASTDSLKEETHYFWASYTRYNLFSGVDLLTNVQGKRGNGETDYSIGVALRGGTERANISIEAVRTDDFNVGVVAEVNVMQNVWLVVSLSPEDSENGPDQLVANTKLRWNLGE